MLLLYANNVDVTENLGKDTLKITEQLNNRVNTCTFRMDQLKISEGQSVEFFEYLSLTEQTNSGAAVLNYDESFEFTEKFRSGDELLINIKESDQFIGIIDSIDHNAKTITLTENVSANVLKGAKIGRKIFGGTTMKNPEEEIGNSTIFSYKVNASDYSEAINRQIVVDTFADQFLREIVSRIVYKFTSEDFKESLETFESAWTESGNARVMTTETTDKIEGNACQTTGILGAGVAKWTKTISSIDVSSADHFKLWFKVATGQGENISAFKFRIGQDSSNYYEGSCDWIGNKNEGCWSLFSFLLSKMDITGSPDLSAVTWLEIEMTSTATVSVGSIYFDQLNAIGNGFTLNNTKRGNLALEDIRVQYKKLTVVLEELAKLYGDFWFVDYDKDINFFTKDENSAPFSITDTSENYGDLRISADISKLKNRQTIRGGITPAEALYTQEKIVDGVEESWRLDYPPKDLTLYTDTGAGYVEKTVGVENLTAETSVDYLYNFNEKTIRRASAAILSSGDKIKYTYYPYKAIRVQVKNQASVDAMKALVGGDGIFDGAVITDAKIRTWEEARQRARAEVDAYSNAILTATFKTEKDGLTAGQVIKVTDTDRGIDEDFLIQKVTKQSKAGDLFLNTVIASSTMFGIIEFFQLLLKRSEEGLVDVSEIVDVVTSVDEVLTIDDIYSLIKKTKTFQAGDSKNYTWDFVWESGSVTDDDGSVGHPKNNWTATFGGSETGTVEFDTASNYNDSKALKIETEVGGTGKSISVSNIINFAVRPSKEHNLKAWLEIPSVLTGVGVTLSFYQFENQTDAIGDELVKTNIFSGETAVQDFNRYIQTITTHADTAWGCLEIKVEESVGEFSVSDIMVEETSADTTSNPGSASFCQAI